MEIKRIPPEIEDAFRDALGHAARAEADALGALLDGLTEEQVASCAWLCTVATGYAAIDACGREWPSESNLRTIAQNAIISNNAKKSGLTEQEIYDFVARVSLRFEPINEVFPEPERMVILPFYITAHVLIALHPAEGKWWNFLDKIEAMFEISEAADLDVTPAIMLRARRTRLEEKRRNQQSSQ
jgi:hypothetical protein